MQRVKAMTARQFKNVYCNKAAQIKARQEMAVRTNLGLMIKDGVAGAVQAKNKLNEVWIKREMSPKDFHKPQKVTPCLKTL